MLEEWTLPPHQDILKNQVVWKFGYDDTGVVRYRFNSLGFRSPEITNQSTVFAIGNSISFGVGIDEQKTFLYKTSQYLNKPYANLSFGCYVHENHDNLQNLTNLAKRNHEDILLIQLNNLDRNRIGGVVDGNDHEFCRYRFFDYFEKIQSILKHKRYVLMYWDNIEYDLPTSIMKQILIHNKGHLDHSLSMHPNSFGPRSHDFIYKILSSHFKKSG